jgi:uncharacterized protein YhbP (UPF0306 family)
MYRTLILVQGSVPVKRPGGGIGVIPPPGRLWVECDGVAEEKSQIELPQHVLDYLGEHKTLTLATASADGTPRAATFLYVNKGPAIYMWVRPHSTTAKHVEENQVVSFAIDDYSDDWRQTRGIQGQAQCEVVLDGEEIARAALMFGQKYPDLSTGQSTVGIFFMRLRPTQVEFIDNTKGRGAKSTEEFGVEYHRDVIFSIL